MSISPEQLVKSGTEHAHQVALMQMIALHQQQYPDACKIFAIPNGGVRDAITGAKLKAEGVKPGVADLMLPVARRSYHGLFLEMKKLKGGTQSSDQKEFQKQVTADNYLYVVAHGWQQAWETLLSYLGG